ncbi:MAG TPA: C40 family peptidase [Streptosporangiaceae bacterium]|nr:C40 family peptidase [Streptosporangiaceae bacterium]
MGTHPFTSNRWVRAGGATAVTVLAVAGLLTAVGPAGAQPQPTLGQVQARLTKLTNQMNVLTQRYDQQTQALKSAQQRLGVIQREVKNETRIVTGMRGQVASIASTLYEDGSLTSPAALLTSNNPQSMLSQSAILVHLSTSNSERLRQFLGVSHQLLSEEQASKRTEQAVAGLRQQLAGQKRDLQNRINQQQALRNSLTPAQQAQTLGGSGGSTGGTYTGPTGSQADKAVQFAYAQLGCPYIFGATGPCNQGFDCSGLTMSAWAAAGVSIPRDSYGQATLPSVPQSAMQPGDILEFAGDSHVGIYVGGGMLIDAPQSGMNVEKISLSSPWYAQNFDGAVRP